MVIKYIIKWLLLFQLVSFSCFTSAVESRGVALDRLQYLSKLLNTSSGAQQVIKSDNKEALDLRLEAIDLYNKAERNINNGHEEEAIKMFGQSAKLMFTAIRKAAPAHLASDKSTREYLARKESVNSLKQAFERITDENNDAQVAKKLNKQLDQLINKGDKYLKSGDYAEARVEIDKAYHLLKMSIESVRGGQTLVRSLNFKTSEEEYKYELDRNETHHMLIGLLVNGKDKSEYTQKQMSKFIGEAKSYRTQADDMAEKGEFEKAIELLEISTKQLVRAIRIAGVYIPG